MDASAPLRERGRLATLVNRLLHRAARVGVLGVSDPNDSRALATPAQPAGVYGLSNSSVPSGAPAGPPRRRPARALAGGSSASTRVDASAAQPG